MRLLLGIVGTLILLVGALPYLVTLTFLSFLEVIPTEGIVYQGIIMATGAITLFLGFRLRNPNKAFTIKKR